MLLVHCPAARSSTNASYKQILLQNTQTQVKQECAAVEGLPAMGPSLQLTTCVLPHGDIKCCHLVNHLDPVNHSWWQSSIPLVLVLYPTLLGLIIRLTLTQLPCPVTFDLEIGPRGARVTGILPTMFGIRRPFRFFSRWRHGTERRTDRRTASIHNGTSF